MTLDLLDVLFGIRESLGNVVVEVSPGSDADRLALRRLVQLRDRVSGVINRIVEAKLSDSSRGVNEAVDRLSAINDQLGKVSQNIEGVKSAIDLAGSVLGILSDVAGAVL